MKKYLSAGAALALTLVVAACGGDSSSSGGASTTAASGSSEPITELRWASIPPRRADFQTSFDHATASLVAPVAQGLVTYDERGKVIPALAETVEQRDDVTWVYTLRTGIRFSDGKPLTIEDAVWSLNRNLAKDANTGANYANVKSIRAEGDEIVFTLKRPDVAFANLPAFCGQIIQKAAAEKGGVDKIGTPTNLPIGTGPYRFASFSSDVGATLVPNPHWSGPEPAVQKVTVKFFRDDSALALALRSGEVDGSFFVANQKLFEFPGVKLVPALGSTQFVVSLNTIVEPFNDVHVRRAIAYATNREGIVNSVMSGAATVNETLTPASLYGNVAPADEVEATFDALPRYDYDLEAAKAEMAKSRYPDGFTTAFPADAAIAAVRMAQVMAPDLAKIGIKAEIKSIPSSEMVALLYGPRDKLGMFVGAYGSTYPDPTALMSYWLSPEQARVNGLNSANYKNAEMARLLNEQSQATDGSERLRLIGEAFRLMKEDVPYVPLFTTEDTMVLSDQYAIAGYSPWTRSFAPWPLLVRKAS